MKYRTTLIIINSSKIQYKQLNNTINAIHRIIQQIHTRYVCTHNYTTILYYKTHV